MVYKKGCVSWNKGKKFPETHKINLSKSHKGKKLSDETKKKMSDSHLNNEQIIETQFKKGYKPWNYIDGRSKFLTTARYGDDWENIRKLIYLRDKFTCQECGITMNETKKAHHIHHKIPFLISFDNSLSNLITLCPSCHRKIEAEIMRKLKMKKMEAQ
jgi:predicted HNH restriction endonuclease